MYRKGRRCIGKGGGVIEGEEVYWKGRICIGREEVYWKGGGV